MNGRIYDGLLGKFLSADVVVQNPASLQDFNRYSYVRNNPLSLTDPSGWEYAPPMFVQTMQAAFVMGHGAQYMAAQNAGAPAALRTFRDTAIGMTPYVGTAVGVKQDIQDLRDPKASTLSKVVAGADLVLVAVTLGAESSGGARRAVTGIIHEAQAAEKTLRTEAHAAEQVVKQEARTVSHEASNLKQVETATVDAKPVQLDITKPANVVEKLPNERLTAKPSEPGRPPVGDDGHPVELHHTDQAAGNNSPLVEKTRTDHRGGDNFENNHPNTGKAASAVNRSEFNKMRRQYWKKESASGRFEDIPMAD